MIGCATLAKSPNCPSQSVSVSGAARAVAVLEAHHGHFAERRVVDLERDARRRRRAGAGCTRRRWSTSCSTSWRWEKVPRSTSCPEKRMDVPSVRIDANASASACPQSIPPASPIASRRRSSCLASRGCGVNDGGQRSSASLSSMRRAVESSRTGRLDRRGRLGKVAVVRARIGLRLVEQRLQVRGDGRVGGVDLRLRHDALLTRRAPHT